LKAMGDNIQNPQPGKRLKLAKLTPLLPLPAARSLASAAAPPLQWLPDEETPSTATAAVPSLASTATAAELSLASAAAAKPSSANDEAMVLLETAAESSLANPAAAEVSQPELETGAETQVEQPAVANPAAPVQSQSPDELPAIALPQTRGSSKYAFMAFNKRAKLLHDKKKAPQDVGDRASLVPTSQSAAASSAGDTALAATQEVSSTQAAPSQGLFLD
jgi:hypothetical protein